MSDLKRINRMIKILNILEKRGRATRKGLADQFGVTERTIFRDMQALEPDFLIKYEKESQFYRFGAQLNAPPSAHISAPPL